MDYEKYNKSNIEKIEDKEIEDKKKAKDYMVLVLGIFSFVPLVGVLISIVTIIMFFFSQKSFKAIIGLVLAIISIILSILYFSIFVFIFSSISSIVDTNNQISQNSEEDILQFNNRLPLFDSQSNEVRIIFTFKSVGAFLNNKITLNNSQISFENNTCKAILIENLDKGTKSRDSITLYYNDLGMIYYQCENQFKTIGTISGKIETGIEKPKKWTYDNSKEVFIQENKFTKTFK